MLTGYTKSFERGGGPHGTSPNQFQNDDPSCDIDGKAQSNLRGNGRACHDSYDEHRDDSPNLHTQDSRNGRQNQQSSSSLSKKGRDKVSLDSAKASPDVSALGVQRSTKTESWLRLLDGCLRSDNPFSCPSFSCSCLPDVEQSSDKRVDPSEQQIVSCAILDLSENIGGNGVTADASASHTADRVFGSSSYDTFFCSDSDSLTNAYRHVKFKPKDLIPIPWMVAMALQQDGWWQHDHWGCSR